MNEFLFLEKSRALREQFVRPVCLSLLHANFMRPEDKMAAIRTEIAFGARAISDEQIGTLLSDREWRGRLVAGWFAGLSKRAAFVEQVAALLLASEMGYAGQGYCVALGLIGDDECRKYLRAYLAEYLPLRGRFYDQEWAIGALAYIERKSPAEFLLPELWTEGHTRIDPLLAIQEFSELVDFLNEHKMRAVS